MANGSKKHFAFSFIRGNGPGLEVLLPIDFKGVLSRKREAIASKVKELRADLVGMALKRGKEWFVCVANQHLDWPRYSVDNSRDNKWDINGRVVGLMGVINSGNNMSDDWLIMMMVE